MFYFLYLITMEKVRSFLIALAVEFDSLPDWVKRVAYHIVSFVAGNLALVLMGQLTTQAFLALCIAEVASFLTWVGKYYGVKAGDKQ